MAHLRVIRKPIRYFMSLYSNVGRSSKGSQDNYDDRKDWNYHFLAPRCRLRPPCHGTPTNIRMILIPPESRVLGLHFFFAADSLTVWAYLLSGVRGELRKTLGWHSSLLAHYTQWPFKVIRGRWFVCQFLHVLVINSNLGSISHRFWDTAT